MSSTLCYQFDSLFFLNHAFCNNLELTVLQPVGIWSAALKSASSVLFIFSLQFLD